MALFNRKNEAEAKPGRVNWYVPGGQYLKLSKAVFEQPHTLIAGATGSGKSVLLNGIMRDFLRLYAPSEAELMLIDPKQLELDYLKKLPHVIGYADNEDEIMSLLLSALEIMAARCRYCKTNGLRFYPGKALYIVIDELLPLMTGAKKGEFQRVLGLLLTQARAANIHRDYTDPEKGSSARRDSFKLYTSHRPSLPLRDRVPPDHKRKRVRGAAAIWACPGPAQQHDSQRTHPNDGLRRG